MEYLYSSFYRNIKDHHLIEENDTVISAFSGGKDSVALILLLMHLRSDIRFDLKAAYFNHRLRNDSGEEEKWVSDFMAEKRIDLVKGTADVIRFKSENRLNLENAASLSRYDFLEKVADKFKNSKIATGHSASDLTETFFIKLFRGSGLQGLSGIYGLKGQRIIRPLLIFSKTRIIEFLQRNKENFYSDPTNRSDVFLRNNIRNNLIPEIEKIEPAIDRHVFRTVSILQEEYSYFRDVAERFLSGNLINGQILPMKKFRYEPVSVRRHIVREFIRLLKGNLLNIDFTHIEQLACHDGKSGGVSIPGIDMKVKKGYIYPLSIFIPDYHFPVNTPGEFFPDPPGARFSIEISNKFTKPADNFEIIVPEEKLVFPLLIRNSLKTDKYRKINSEIKQKVIEMIRASGIPSEIRNLIPVLVNGNGEIIWAPGSPVSEDYKVTGKETGRYYRIKMDSAGLQIL